MMINTLFKDPVIFIAGLVVLATIAILVWALRMLQSNEQSQSAEEMPIDEPQERIERKNDEQGLLEARVKEVCSGIGEITRRLDDMEKQMNTAPDVEKLIQKLEAKIDSIPASKGTGTGAEDIERIEAKLDSIRKLLVLLTESGNPKE